jgi:hypothetical protein
MFNNNKSSSSSSSSSSPSSPSSPSSSSSLSNSQGAGLLVHLFQPYPFISLFKVLLQLLDPWDM